MSISLAHSFPDKVRLRIRFTLDNLKLDDDVLNIPLFMAEQAERLIGLALEQRRVASKDSYSFGFSGRRLVQGYFKWCKERGYH